MVTANVPSDQFDDLRRDVQDATRFSNATAQYQNRVGRTITPIPMRDDQYAAKIASLGFTRLEGVTFETGATVPDGKSLLLWATAGGGTGFYYYFSGEIPSGGKIVPPDSTPASTGGTGAGGWLVIDDLEQRLADGSADINGLAAKYISRTVLASSFATPNSTTDQSAQLQAAWQFAADNNIPFVIDGVYWVGLNAFNPPTIGANRPTSLHVISNTDVFFMPNAAIKLLPTAEPLYYVLNFYTAENVNIYCPVVYGDRFTHLDTVGESGNCYNIVTCKNIYLHKPKAYDAWGDGFYIGREFFTNIADPVEFVTLFEPEGYNSSRNDISLCHGHDINIVRPLTSGAGRTAPGAGIDIEPEFGNNVAVEPTLKRVTIESPKSVGKTSGILMAFFRPIGDWDVSVTGCATDYDSATPLQLIRSESAINSQGVLTIDNFKSFNCFGNSMVHNWFADGKCHVDIGSFTHSRANRTNDAIYRHAVEISRDGSVSGDLTIQRLINSGSPNCLEPFRVSDATTLQNTKIDFISQGRSNSGGVISATALIGRSCKLNTERRNLSITGLSSQLFFNTDYDVNTSGGDVSFQVSGNVRQTHTFEKISSANTLTLTASAGKGIIKTDGSSVSSYAATALYSYIELQDDGDGNKIVINQRGNWA